MRIHELVEGREYECRCRFYRIEKGELQTYYKSSHRWDKCVIGYNDVINMEFKEVVKELTEEEVSDLLGYKVKVVKEDIDAFITRRYKDLKDELVKWKKSLQTIRRVTNVYY